MPVSAPWIREKSDSTLNPSAARNALTRLADAWPGNLPELTGLVETFPLGGDALLHLLAYSPAATTKLLRDPEALVWLSRENLCAGDRSLAQMKSDLSRLKTGAGDRFDEGFRDLRRQKSRETLRIALREIAQAAPLSQTALELSLLAELCMAEVFAGWNRHFRSRWGEPTSRFSVLALGKFGGSDLNFSSDIDVIFLFSENGQLNTSFSYQQFFTRLAEKIVATFSARHEAGTLFRIDVRLRPEGNSGPLVRSLDSMEHYYAAYGETWERMALIKARPVAGDGELGYDFLQRLQPFVFPRHLTTEVLQEIADLKHRIDTELVGPAKRDREIKRGYGGIREIEFVVQSIQLLHGARHPFLQQAGTLKAIDAMRSLGEDYLLDAASADTLADSYRFLRRVEHRLQIENEAQTHLVPNNPPALDRLCASLAIEPASAFLDKLSSVTRAVHIVFDAHFKGLPAPGEKAPDLSAFASPEQAAQLLASLGGSETKGAVVSPRTRRVFRDFKPILLRSLAYAAEPDLVLNRFVRFVENYGIRAPLFELLIQHPRLLELLTRLFDSSSFVSEIAIRRPELVDEVARAGGLDERMTVDRYLEKVGRLAEMMPDRSVGDRLRIFRNAELLRIALRDVLALAPMADVLLEYTALAESCLAHYLRETGAGNSLTVIAMGKFGARELSYGSDLDVVFAGNDVESASRLLAEFARASEEGPLDEIDARLRPEGRSGLLACSVDAFRSYFENRAQLWEAQALTKARPVAGPDAEPFMDLVQETWRRFGRRDDLFQEIAQMLERIHRERGGEDFFEFKTGRGGIIDLEFAVQARQMRAGLWETNTLAAASKLVETGAISTEAGNAIDASYQMLRRCSFVLRRLENRSVSKLPADAGSQEALAKRLGFPSPEAFLEAYRKARERARTVADELLEK